MQAIASKILALLSKAAPAAAAAGPEIKALARYSPEFAKSQLRKGAKGAPGLWPLAKKAGKVAVGAGTAYWAGDSLNDLSDRLGLPAVNFGAVGDRRRELRMLDLQNLLSAVGGGETSTALGNEQLLSGALSAGEENVRAGDRAVTKSQNDSLSLDRLMQEDLHRLQSIATPAGPTFDDYMAAMSMKL